MSDTQFGQTSPTPNNEMMQVMTAWSKMFENTMLQPAATPNSIANNPADVWSKMIDQMWQANPYSKLFPLEPAEITHSFQQIWLDAVNNPARFWANYNEFWLNYSQMLTTATLKFWGYNQTTAPVATPDKGDKRFAAPDWQQNPVFDAIKQGYLLAATTLLKAAGEVKGLDAHQQQKMTFYLRQFLDAISPTNFTFTNPQVIHETLQSGGQNLVNGINHLMRDVRAGQVKMTDTEAFAPGRNLALTPGQVVYRNQLIELIQYQATTDKVQSVPILFMPPWINKFYILDMQPENSLIRYLVEQGFTVFVVSWKNPDATMEHITFDDYLTLGPLAAMEVIKEITGSPKINPVGYCIGGTLLSMTLPYLHEMGDDTCDTATFLVALQDFSEVGDTGIFIDEPQVTYIESQMLERGYLDSRSMATMFNMLRANDLIWSNVVNNYLLGKEPPAFDLLYWNNDGTRMARDAHSFYLHNTYLENNLVKPGHVHLRGVPIDLGQLHQDIYAVGTQQDHIVPWQSAWRITQLADNEGRSRFILGGSGHIAGVINPPSKGRNYWTNDKPVANAAQWFESAEAHKGSWWPDWVAWLKARSGEAVPARELGSPTYPPLTPAPGTYVLEK